MSCEHCNKTNRVMVSMAPGPDGKSWALCISCWIDGVRPLVAKNDQAKPKTKSVAPKVKKAS